MPSKGKKPSRPHSSPLSRSPSTPVSARGPQSDNDEAHLRELLSQASSKYPNFINETAIVGTICDQDSNFTKGNQARVWLSESTMISNSLAPGSLVSVSLPSSGERNLDNFPLGNFCEGCARQFGSDFGNEKFSVIGYFFAIATVSPSRKVLKNEVRLSGGLSCTMGFPATGRSIFVFPIRTSKEPSEAENTTCVYLQNCEHLYLSLVAPEAGLGTNRTDGTFVEAGSGLNGNGIAASPRTPSCQSKLFSPGTAPAHAMKSRDIVSHPNSSMCLDISAARLALADENTKELLQMSAVRWLSGRYLLNGNIVTVPLIFGEICVFRVEGADRPLTGYRNQALMLEEKDGLVHHKIQLSNSLEVVLLVGCKTDVHVYDSISPASEKPSESSLPEVGLTSEARSREAGDRRRLGGLSKEFEALKEIIEFSLTSKGLMPRYKGVLLYGPPGTGKTSLASYCAQDANVNLFSINGPEIVSEYYGESEQSLREVFDSARKAAPAVVFIDELDAIAPTRNDGGEALSLRMVATLLKLMDEIKKDDGVLVIAATNRPDSIDPAMRRPGRLDREIEIGVPSPEQRSDILQTLLCGMNHSLSILEIQSLASGTHGFVGADLAALCNAAAWNALHRYIEFTCSDGRENNPSLKLHRFVADIQGFKSQRNDYRLSTDLTDSLSSSLSELTVSQGPLSPISSVVVPESCDTPLYKHNRTYGEVDPTQLIVTMEDFEKAKVKVRPSAMREVMLELPKVRWEDVGGQEQVKKQLIEAVRWPQILPDAFERIGTRPPRGLLMMGPPGCSKTLMARAVASEAKLNFLAVKGPELFSKWVGESEKAVRSLFAKARANSPAIIFFDEIDGLAISRGQQNDSTSVADRVLSQLLVEMDGLNQRAGVTVIAATNRPDKIDPALLRPGRFDRLLEVQPPDETDREVIFRIHMRKIACHPDVSTKDLAFLTEGYTGADIKSVCREAALAALEESLEISEVSMEHFKIGIRRVRPTDVQSYRTLATQFRRTVDSSSLRNG